jgi:minimal PKS acyl carrier protein
VRLITLRELETMMREFSWEDDSAQPFEQVPDQSFEDLGYDSLALLETHSRIKRDYGVEIGEDDLDEVTTPRRLVDLVNARLQAA